MKTIFKNVLSVWVFILLLGSCKKDPEIITPVEYESCCGTEPVEYNVMVGGNEYYVFVPNAFTPNGDGINDRFMPVLNPEITLITLYVIERLEPENDTSSTLLYQQEFIELSEFDTKAWDGKDMQGRPYKGAFKYTIHIRTSDMKDYGVQSTACAIQCGPDAAIFKDKTSCFYGSQANASGKFESGKGHGEADCFK